MKPYFLTIDEARRQIESGELTPDALFQSVAERIDAVDLDLHAYLERASYAAPTQNGPLFGIPGAIKDVLAVRGTHTTAGSKMLEKYVAPYTATVVTRLAKAGFVLTGKTNCDEFAMGASNETSAYGPVKNPWNTGLVPGGSSGGSAAAVAAGLALFALGSDTGGSIRQPAAFTGVVGMKPTYGRVSRYGLLALCSSFDTVGPLTRSVRDAAEILQMIAGSDPKDATTVRDPVPSYTQALTGDIKGARVGIPKEYFGEGIEDGVRDAVMKAIEELKKLGAHVKEVSLPHTPYAIAVYYIILPCEASTNLARYDGIRYGHSAHDAAKTLLDVYERTREEGFGKEVKRRIMLGTFALSSGYYDAYYLKAQKVRTIIAEEFERVFREVDCLVAPTSPTVAFPIGEKSDDPLAMYLADALTCPVNIAGLPGISVPCGYSNGLPVGLQIIGPKLGEEIVFRVAHAYEQATEWHTHHPSL